MNRIFSVVSFTSCTVLGTAVNLVTCHYFARSTFHPLFRMLLTLNAACDTAISILSAGIDITGMVGYQRSPFQDRAFCVIWGSSYVFLFTISSHILLILAVLRLIKIWKPTYVLNQKALYVVLALDVVLVLVIRIMNGESITFLRIGYCATNNAYLGPSGYSNLTTGEALSHLTTMVVSIGPCPIIIMIYLVTIGFIIYQHRYYTDQLGRQGNNDIRQRCVRTVCLIGALYIAFTLSFWTVSLVFMFASRAVFMTTVMQVLRNIFLVRNIQLNSLANGISVLVTHKECRSMMKKLLKPVSGMYGSQEAQENPAPISTRETQSRAPKFVIAIGPDASHCSDDLDGGFCVTLPITERKTGSSEELPKTT